MLRTYIEQQKERYDYILIDCMPSLGMITINAFAKKGVGNSLDEVGEAQERVARLFRGISIFQDYLTNC